MSPRSILLAPLTVALLSIAPTAIEAAEYTVDNAHSAVTFKILHLKTAYFLGRFGQVSGKIDFDPKKLGDSRVQVEVDATTLNTFNNDRDKHIKSPEFLNVEKHQKITFEASGFKAGKEKDTYQVKGKLTFLGVSKDLNVVVKKTGEGSDPWGSERIGFWTTFKIKRSDFGMGAMLDLLGDEVELTVSLESVKKKEEK
ncbi:MAG: YceI family protein [Planctomycetes bacterium]|nr:YceI family protein [Planctomycetota bacterium]